MSVINGLRQIHNWIKQHIDLMEQNNPDNQEFLEQAKVMREGVERLFGQMNAICANAAQQVDELASRNVQMASFIQGIAENEQGETGNAARHFLMMLARDAIPSTKEIN